MQETTMFDQPETSPWGEIQRCVPICHGVYQCPPQAMAASC